ncbi:diguanylate cyclase domain-containing protein [Chloroflexota bacterium]
MLDKDYKLLLINKTVADLFRKSPQEIIGMSIFGMFPEAIAASFLQNVKSVFDTGKRVVVEEKMVIQDRELYNSTSLNPVNDGRGRVIAVTGIVRDITERKEMQNKLAHLQYQNELILNSAGEGIVGINSQGIHTFINPSAAKLLGYQVEELIGKQSHVTWHYQKPDGSPYPEDECPVYKTLKDGEIYRIDNEVFWKKDGTFFPVEYKSTPIKEKGNIIGAVVTFTDITEHKKAEESLIVLATHDTLTSLPNRKLLYDRFNIAVANAQRNKKRLAIMSLDLDRFKIVNDKLGHDIGDKLLVAAAGRMTSILREVDTVARIGGDEFALLLWDIDHKEAASKVAQKVVKEFRQPFLIDGHKLNNTVSVGVAIYPENGKDIKDLLKISDKSLYLVKESGRDNYQISPLNPSSLPH